MSRNSTGSTLPPPESGTFGGAIMHSYMWLFWCGALGVCFQFAKADLSADGAKWLWIAFGVSSSGWAWFWVVVCFFMSIQPVGAATRIYWRFTGRTYVDDRIGFAKAGGQDISSFSGLVAVVGVVFVFARYVPSGLFSWLRPVLLLLAVYLVGIYLASVITTKVLLTLYGPPKLQPDVPKFGDNGSQ